MYFRGKEYSDKDYRFIKEGLEYNTDLRPYLDFDFRQRMEVLDGLKDCVDISVYAKPEFNGRQMEVMRKGLLKGFDVSVYSKPEYSEERMRGILRCLEKGYDVSVIDKPEYSDDMVCFISSYIGTDIEYEEYIKSCYTDKQRMAISCELYSNMDIKDCVKPDYSPELIKLLINAKEQNIDIKPYLEQGYSIKECYCILDALRKDVSLDKIFNYDYTPEEMSIVIDAESEGINVREYLLLGYNLEQIWCLYYAKLFDEDTSQWFKPEYPAYKMRAFKEQLKYHNSVCDYVDYNFDRETEWQLSVANDMGMDLLEYAKAGYFGKKLEIIRKLLLDGKDIQPLMNPELNENQFSVISYGIESGVDVSIYNDSKYNWSNMWGILHLLENEKTPKPDKHTFSEIFPGDTLNNYSDEQLTPIFWAMNKGFDVTKYLNPSLSVNTLKNMYWIEVNAQSNIEFTEEQKEKIKQGVERDLPMLLYAKPIYSPEQMQLLMEGLNVFGAYAYTYSNENLSVEQMYFVYRALKDGLEGNKLANSSFNTEQQRLIYFGLLANIDVDSYADVKNDVDEMKYMIVILLVDGDMEFEEAIKEADMLDLWNRTPKPDITYEEMKF